MNLCSSFQRVITPPARCSAAAAGVVIAGVAVLSSAAALPTAVNVWALSVLAALLLVAVLLRAVYAVHLTLLALIWELFVGFFPAGLQFWPLDKLLPLAAYGLAVVLVAPLRHSVGWLRAGRFGSEMRAPVIGVSLISAMALIAWVIFERPNLYRHLAMIPTIPLWGLPLVGIGFAFGNAAMEEAVFRGVMMEALDSALGPGVFSVTLQAVSFAAFHYQAGFPNGVSGFLMALVYGLMLGGLRRRSGGMLAPWAAHVAADLVIFAVLASRLRF